MIGGINPNNAYTGNAPATRGRADVARVPAVRPEVLTDENPNAPVIANGDRDAAGGQDTQVYLRRVQARAAADDVRLEPFRAGDIPLANARALQTFATVAGQNESIDGLDAELTGIDIRV